MTTQRKCGSLQHDQTQRAFDKPKCHRSCRVSSASNMIVRDSMDASMAPGLVNAFGLGFFAISAWYVDKNAALEYR